MGKYSIIGADMLLLFLPFDLEEVMCKNNCMQQTATNIFNAWQKGESGNGYDSFKKFIDADTFNYFSHPLSAHFTGQKAYDKMMALVKGREEKPNQLSFSNIITYSNDNSFCFQFNSEGKVSDGFDYKGYNIIQFEIEDNKLIGFREYFGFIDTAWFK
jgi:hypothetical protein